MRLFASTLLALLVLGLMSHARYQLRAAVYLPMSGGTGSVPYDLEVSDFRKEPFSMSGVVLTSTNSAVTPTPDPDLELAALLRQQPPTAAQAAQNPADIRMPF